MTVQDTTDGVAVGEQRTNQQCIQTTSQSAYGAAVVAPLAETD